MARVSDDGKTPLGARLVAVRRSLGFPERKAFAKKYGVSEGKLGRYENGQVQPPADILAILLKELSVDLNWLVSGRGDMFLEQPDQEVDDKNAQSYAFADPPLPGTPGATDPTFKRLYSQAAQSVDAQIRSRGVKVTVEERIQRILEEFERLETLDADSLLDQSVNPPNQGV